ncbi:Sensor histidine kinase RcsC [compost metagenome]
MAKYWSLLLLVGLALLVLLVSHLRLRQHVRYRQQSEARLEDELALNEALLACLPEPVAARNADRRYVALNPAFEAFFGVKKDDYLGTELHIRSLPGSSSDALVSLQEEALNTMQARHFLLPMQNAAGQMRTAIAWAVPFRKRDGTLGGVVSMYVDVTDIHEARQRARQFELRLKDVTKSLPAVVLQLRAAPGQSWEVTYFAGNTKETFGPRALNMITDPKTASRLFEREDFLRAREALDQAGDKPKPIEMELKLSNELGERWVQFRAVPRWEGTSTVWTGVFFDVTGKHNQSEMLLEAKEGAEAALRAKEGFLAMMSHEIRTPMNGVLGLVELLQNTSLTVEQHRMLALAQESGLALAQILDDILDYAKIEAGRLSIMRAPLDVRELLDSVMSLLLPQAHEKGLQLRQVVGVDVPAVVLADGVRLRQILLNLFGNAIKFTERGSVSLHAGVELDNAGAIVLVVKIEDTGIGIPKDDIQLLFAPFVQSERSSTRRFGGTGLGLSISRRLAHMMDGQLALESEEGIGTVASLRVPCSILSKEYELPMLKGRPVVIRVRGASDRDCLAASARVAGMQVLEHAQSAAPDDAIHFIDMDHPEDVENARHVIFVSAVPKQLGFRIHDGMIRLSTNPLRWTAFLGAIEVLLTERSEPAGQVAAVLPASPNGPAPMLRKVLVAEDHPINREVIQQQLELLGYVAAVVGNGEEALRVLETETFDMVITDCHMPVLDGFDLTRAIRSSTRAELSSIPVVGVTATTVREELLRCFEVGMNTYVLKPTTLASLQKALFEVAEELSEVSAEAEAEGEVASVPEMAAACEHFDSSRIDLQQIRDFLSGMLPNVSMGQDYWQALHEDRQALCVFLTSGSVDDLRAWCHRSKGALSLFGQPCIDQLMDQFHLVVAQAPRSTVEAAAGGVLHMYDHLFSILESAVDEGHSP